ncbi:hypothetical protein [Rhodococcus sp. (in: high G+C Gram-positive bacteria)]|uniref:hypothetical protein n=1 Tax=Rhodococcus sp. TaxID=1831 RepID=UPI003B8A7DC7
MVTWVFDDVVVKVTNRSRNKIATSGVRVDVGMVRPPNPQAQLDALWIPDIPTREFRTINPGQSHGFAAKNPLLATGLRSAEPTLTAVLSDWHFNSADIDDRCLAAHPGLHQ